MRFMESCPPRTLRINARTAHADMVVHSEFTLFKLDHSTASLAAGEFVGAFIYAGGHVWRIRCYPHGSTDEDNGEYIPLFLELMLLSKSTKGGAAVAIFEAFVMNGDESNGVVSPVWNVHVYQPGHSWGWPQYTKRPCLDSSPCTSNGGGAVTIVCGVVVVAAGGCGAIPVPPPDVGTHLGRLLDRALATDVSFVVDGEAFPAHRAVLAARSPVFEAELLGPTADATSPSITVQDIEPAVFRAMLRFMYTDALPGDDEFEGSPTDMMQHLLAAADRYALDRLKLMCAAKLWETITVDTFASSLACAETYNCPALRSRCVDFFAAEENLKKIVFTEGFLWLVPKFPALAAELKERVGM
ncbi:hypothetical protein ACP70R_016121 [Stipagrostis hirtigluma subsp. patula]